MDEQSNTPQRPANPRRRRRTRMQIIKEDYLPVAIGGLAVLLVLIFVIGGIVRGVQGARYRKALAEQEALAAQQAQEALDAEANQIYTDAKLMGSQFDYQGALELIDSFSGNIQDYPELVELRDSYSADQEDLVEWSDPTDILSLSFQVLIADPERAFVNAAYGNSYNRNFITTGEFQRILQQLYENGYILVSLADFTNGTEVLPLYLPADKKPLLLTQTNVNYYTYMVDGDGDKLPDSQGAGFASRLTLDENGNFTCEMVDAQGQTVTGAFDMVPILEAFIETHPDFSYRGARAVLAVTGYDGIFGYRTSPAALEFFGEDYYRSEVAEAEAVVSELRHLGYELACYTYENEPYGSYTAAQISDELVKWDEEVTPILGQTDIFVFSRNSDLGDPGVAYDDERFNLIYSYGYTNYLGFCNANESWSFCNGEYFRQGRILVTGSALAHHSLWFEGMFDAASILDPARGEVPA